MNSFFIDKNLFAINMKNFRKKSKLTQITAAENLNITRTSLMNYESGKSLPEITTLLNICCLYKCSLSQLLSIENYNFIDIPQMNNFKYSDKQSMFNKFKEQLNILTELNLKNIKLNSEIKAEKNKLILNNKTLSSSKNKYSQLINQLNKTKAHYNKSLEQLNDSKKRYDKSLEQLNDSKKRYDKSLEQLNNTKLKYESLIEELTKTKNEYSKLIDKLNRAENFHLNSVKDIDDTRDYFLSSFSTILKNANSLVDNLENVSDYTDIKKNITEEFSNELIPHDDNETYFDEDIEEETVDVMFIDANIAAGEPIPYENYPEIKKITLKARYPLTKENANNFYILKVKGDSMNKVVEDGEKILVRSTCCVSNGSIAVVNILDESECTLKHYYLYNEKNLIILRPDSYDSSYKDMLFSISDHNIIVQGEYVGNISEFL